MKPRRSITPYMHSTDNNINASITLMKLYKRIRTIGPTHKPSSHYQVRLNSKQATRQVKLHIVR